MKTHLILFPFEEECPLMDLSEGESCGVVEAVAVDLSRGEGRGLGWEA